MWVGADKDPDPTVMLFDRGIIAPNETVDGNWEKSGYMHLGSEPWLKVNLNGERFSNESVPYDFILHAAFMEPGHLYNTIYDSNGMEQGGLIQKADTLEELAEKLNMPADAFVATVERYNELCAKGEDEDFGKGELPYAAAGEPAVLRLPSGRYCAVHAGRSAHQHQDAGAGY